MLEPVLDNALVVYVALGLVALGLLVGLWTTRKRGYALGLAGVAAAALLFWLLTYLLPTDQKRIVAAIEDMSAAVHERNTDRIFAHISDQFRYAGMGKEGFRGFVDRHLKNRDVTEVLAYGFEQAEVSRPDRTAVIEFNVKPKGPVTGDAAYYHCKATFALDPDGQWRLKGFDVFNPYADSKTPMNIPQLMP
jgi:hypothetical protein